MTEAGIRMLRPGIILGISSVIAQGEQLVKFDYRKVNDMSVSTPGPGEGMSHLILVSKSLLKDSKKRLRNSFELWDVGWDEGVQKLIEV